ncbi:MAG TPA: hypothetical protein VFJ24_11200 [Gaiellales bacterium]|nr:hypothetical protein [Gaiellales bacterium]
MTSSKQQTIRTFRRLLPGGALVVIGSLLALSGGGVLAAFGTDGSLASGPHLLSTPTSAIVSPVTSIKHTSGVASVAGQPTLRLSASPVQGTAGVFVGIGPAADVNRYLAGVATEQVTDLSVDPYSITGIRHSGRLNAAPPTAQRFWVARASSTRTAEINWKIRDGQYRVVVMNANGHGGFASTSAIGLTIPNIAIYSIAALLLGLLVAGGGTALLIRATHQPRTNANASSPTASTATAPTL